MVWAFVKKIVRTQWNNNFTDHVAMTWTLPIPIEERTPELLEISPGVVRLDGFMMLRSCHKPSSRIPYTAGVSTWIPSMMILNSKMPKAGDSECMENLDICPRNQLDIIWIVYYNSKKTVIITIVIVLIIITIIYNNDNNNNNNNNTNNNIQ